MSKSFKVLLSNPPWFTHDNRWGIRAGSRWPFTIPKGFSGYLPFPFLLAYTTSFLRENGIDAYFIDSILTRESIESYIERIKKNNFYWVIIETSTPSIDYDLKIAQEISKYTQVALCGPHATVFADDLIKLPFVSAILKGEYEKNSLKLIKTGKQGIYDYDLVEDIDTLPFPYRDFSIYRYSDRFPNTPKGFQLQVWGSRGCPYRCIFCMWPPTMYLNKYRARKPFFILKEIKETFDRFPKLTSVYFDDDTFNINKDRIFEICEGMKKMEIPWAAMCRADTVDIDTFKKMKESFCYAVKFGVESGCQELVNNCNKKLDLKVVEEVVKELKKIGIFVHLTFTWGLPGETKETIEKTKEFYRRVKPDSVQQSFCTPFPGTVYYEKLIQENKLNVDSWSKFDGARDFIFIGTDMIREDLLRYAKL